MIMKRTFRPFRAAENKATYPVEKEGRRSFLRQLAGLVAGGATVSLLAACGQRPVGDNKPPLPDMGGAPPMDAPIDLPIGGGAVDGPPAPIDSRPWWPETSGGMPDAYPAPLDGGPSFPLDGEPYSD